MLLRSMVLALINGMNARAARKHNSKETEIQKPVYMIQTSVSTGLPQESDETAEAPPRRSDVLIDFSGININPAQKPSRNSA